MPTHPDSRLSDGSTFGGRPRSLDGSTSDGRTLTRTLSGSTLGVRAHDDARLLAGSNSFVQSGGTISRSFARKLRRTAALVRPEWIKLPPCRVTRKLKRAQRFGTSHVHAPVLKDLQDLYPATLRSAAVSEGLAEPRVCGKTLLSEDGPPAVSVTPDAPAPGANASLPDAITSESLDRKSQAPKGFGRPRKNAKRSSRSRARYLRTRTPVDAVRGSAVGFRSLTPRKSL